MDPLSQSNLNSDFSNLRNQTGIQSSQSTETTPLVQGSDVSTTKSSWTMRFPGATVCSSCIKSITSGIASLSSGIKKIAWSSYRAVVSLIKPDQVNYSKDILPCDDDAVIPASGSFKAGAGLRNMLAQSLLNAVVGESTKPAYNPSTKATETQGLHQAAKDVNRGIFEIENEHGDGSILAFPMFTDALAGEDSTRAETRDRMMLNEAGKLAELVGGKDNLPFINNLISLVNQTTGNTCNLLYSRRDPALQAKTGIGFPSPTGHKLDGSDADIKYTLEKVVTPGKPDHFIYTFENKAHSKGFFSINNNDKDGAAEVVALDENSRMESTTNLTMKITRNPHFDPTQAETVDNSPSVFEVLHFSNEYTTALSRGEG